MNTKLDDLHRRYDALSRALRWSSGLLPAIWLLLAILALLAGFQDNLWDWLRTWLSADASLFGIAATQNGRFFLLVYLLLGLGTLIGAVTLYLIWQLGRIRRVYRQLSQLPTRKVFTSTPRGLADQPAERDALGFKLLARAVSGLLRHPATQAPYTLVLSGGWGSGKSSLMAQIRRQLTATGKKPGFQDVWFNAWHFQSEQHLLAAFLGSILERCEQMPGFYRRLWWQRMLKQGFWEALRTAFVLAMLLPFVLGMLYALLQQARIIGASGNPTLLATLFGQADKTTLLALTATWAGAAWGLLKAWQERSTLVTGLVPMGRFRLEAARADAGFRRKYQEEFRLLMRATPRGTRFLIFIDDVDRIPGSRVLELLESINFISDTAGQPTAARQGAARLYFVLGMYVQEVARTLGEALDAKGRKEEPEATQHAAHYLAKLVDLVVPLPGLQGCTTEQLGHLLFGSEAPELTPLTPVKVAAA